MTEFAYKIPNEFLIDSGFSKNILRSIGKDFIPQSVIYEKEKKGFNSSINSLIDVNEKKTKEEILDDSPIYNYVDKYSIEKLLKDDYYDNSISKFLFSFLSTKIFLESDLVKGNYLT